MRLHGDCGQVRSLVQLVVRSWLTGGGEVMVTASELMLICVEVMVTGSEVMSDWW